MSQFRYKAERLITAGVGRERTGGFCINDGSKQMHHFLDYRLRISSRIVYLARSYIGRDGWKMRIVQQLLLSLFIWIAMYGSARADYYTYDQSTQSLQHVMDGDPSQVSPLRWEVWLYKRDTEPDGTMLGRWGLIAGASAGAVMQELQQDQDGQDAFLKMFNLPDDWPILSYKNYLGPIAVTESAPPGNTNVQSLQNQINDSLTTISQDRNIFNKAVEAASGNSDPDLGGPFGQIGEALREYDSGLSDAMRKLNNLSQALISMSDPNLAQAQAGLNSINSDLQAEAESFDPVAKKLGANETLGTDSEANITYSDVLGKESQDFQISGDQVTYTDGHYGLYTFKLSDTNLEPVWDSYSRKDILNFSLDSSTTPPTYDLFILCRIDNTNDFDPCFYLKAEGEYPYDDLLYTPSAYATVAFLSSSAARDFARRHWPDDYERVLKESQINQLVATEQPDGTKILSDPSGKTIDGEIDYPNGNKYTGNLTGLVPDGQGMLTYAAGAIYVGSFESGVASGTGEIKYSDGSQYQGQFNKGQREGKGVVISPNAPDVSGVWENDQLSQADPPIVTEPAQNSLVNQSRQNSFSNIAALPFPTLAPKPLNPTLPAVAIAWSANGSWTIWKKPSLSDAEATAESICNQKYGQCEVAAQIVVQPNTPGCISLVQSTNASNLAAAENADGDAALDTALSKCHELYGTEATCKEIKRVCNTE